MIGILEGEVVNHLWQSTIVAFAGALLTLAFRKNRAGVRYGIWLAASLKFLVPFAIFFWLGGGVWSYFASRGVPVAPASPAIAAAVDQIAQPVYVPDLVGSASANHAPLAWISVALLALWAAGFVGVISMRLAAWFRIRGLLRASAPMEIENAGLRVRTAPGLLEPGVVGIFQLTLLLPEGILERLVPRQLESVLAHELAHMRRRDNLTAALHMLVEALFWFHPAIWWIGARLVETREAACDEAVLSVGNEPRDYAEAILGVCKLCVESPLLCVSGVTGADLKKRIRNILSGGISDELNFAKRSALAICAATALLLPIVIGAVGAPAIRAQSSGEPLPSFEVASIKPDPIAADYQGTHIHMNMVGNHYIATGLTAKYLIQFAYGVNDSQISGGPSWTTSDKYAIDAKIDDGRYAEWQKLPPGQKTEDEFKLMFQSLLASRFHLKISRQTKEEPLYALVVAKGGPKFGVSQQTFPDVQRGASETDLLKSQGSHIFSDGNEPITAVENGVSMKAFANTLARRPELEGRLVLDKTGLNDKYTFTLRWARELAGGEDTNTADGPSLWTALEEQLGLKLESTKGPVDTIVIDSIEKPTPN